MENTNKQEYIKVEEFFNTDYVDAASYDNLRKIASIADGLKNSSRKIIHTIIDKNINSKTKVSRLASDVAGYTEYLHGEVSLTGVMVNLAQDYVGSNNIPYIKRDGNFGTRHKPVASAPRYIKTRKEDYLDKIFNKKDYPILIDQHFEGIKIEPRYFVPVLPMLLINGSEGVSLGFAQKILPRNPKTIISELEKVLKGTKKLENVKLGKPFWKGYTGNVKQDEEFENRWHIFGNFIRENKNSIKITEVPIGYNLNKFNEVLDLLDDKNVIQSYKDKSDNDVFEFNVKVKREFSDKYNDEQLFDKLKLSKSITENYTCINEHNRIKVYDNVNGIFSDYYNLRLNYYDSRKKYLIEKLNKQIIQLNSKYLFVKGVVDNQILINNKSKKVIVDQLNKIDKIITIEDSYDYLLRMPIYSLTKEKLIEIKNQIKALKDELKDMKGMTLENMWLNDLTDIKKYIV